MSDRPADVPEPKFCKDCRFLLMVWDGTTCQRQEAFTGWDVVMGKRKMRLASWMRLAEAPCGPEAALFEALPALQQALKPARFP